jgi:hypothetical protein
MIEKTFISALLFFEQLNKLNFMDRRGERDPSGKKSLALEVELEIDSISKQHRHFDENVGSIRHRICCFGQNASEFLKHKGKHFPYGNL